MSLLKAGAVVEDGWVHLDDDAALPPDEVAITVGSGRWTRERETLLRRRGPLGIRLANTDPVEEVMADLPRVALIVLHFPKFTDGRAYSQARRLRARHGFAGELRATGNVLQDQLLLMVRVGFDAFVIEAADAARRFEAAISAYGHFYQPRLSQPRRIVA